MDLITIFKALVCSALFWPGLVLMTAEEMYLKVTGVVLVLVAVSITVATILQRPILMKLLFWS